MPKNKPRDDTITWECMGCGAFLGLIEKDNNDWRYLIPSCAPNIRIYGNAKINCQICGKEREWWWDEIALNQLVYNIKRRESKAPLTSDHTE